MAGDLLPGAQQHPPLATWGSAPRVRRGHGAALEVAAAGAGLPSGSFLLLLAAGGAEAAEPAVGAALRGRQAGLRLLYAVRLRTGH